MHFISFRIYLIIYISTINQLFVKGKKWEWIPENAAWPCLVKAANTIIMQRPRDANPIKADWRGSK